MAGAPYPSDPSDAAYARLAPLLPPCASRGRPRVHARRALLDGMFYLVRTGCHWRALPREYPPWKTVSHYFRLWRRNGTWERLHDTLRDAVRENAGRVPSAAVGRVLARDVLRR